MVEERRSASALIRITGMSSRRVTRIMQRQSRSPCHDRSLSQRYERLAFGPYACDAEPCILCQFSERSLAVQVERYVGFNLMAVKATRCKQRKAACDSLVDKIKASARNEGQNDER